MSLGTDAAFAANAAGDAYGDARLVEMQFRSGVVRLTNWPVDIVALGYTWRALGTMAQIGQLHESEDGAEEKLDVGLSGADDAMLAAAVGDPSEYQDRRVSMWVALMNPQTGQMDGTPVKRFVGVMDQPDADREKSIITMHCRTASYDVRSHPAGLRYTHAQHQLDHPGERGFEYVASLISDTSVWLSARFQASKA